MKRFSSGLRSRSTVNLGMECYVGISFLTSGERKMPTNVKVVAKQSRCPLSPRLMNNTQYNANGLLVIARRCFVVKVSSFFQSNSNARFAPPHPRIKNSERFRENLCPPLDDFVTGSSFLEGFSNRVLI